MQGILLNLSIALTIIIELITMKVFFYQKILLWEILFIQFKYLLNILFLQRTVQDVLKDTKVASFRKLKICTIRRVYFSNTNSISSIIFLQQQRGYKLFIQRVTMLQRTSNK